MPKTQSKDDLQTRLQAFERSEGSVRLEGIDPMADPEYVALKQRILAGEISTDEAIALLLASAPKTHTVAA